ncbi:MAG TPA: DNA repair protein RadA [Actinobacteria bacterium]|nr:DNA repair protein RadA [Actinomycetota bacterium]
MKYLCSTCGHRSAKWMGFCPQCGSRKALVEDQTTRRATPPEVVPVASAAALAADRSPVGIGEIDRVLGGGVVPGAVLLLGGEPGVGKSTLLLQAAGSFAETGCSVLIATAEESSHQVGLRAKRLGVDSSRVSLVADSDIDAILAAADTMRPDLLIVDSIQAVSASGVGSVPGSVSQVRECAARVIQYAKARATAAVLVGHVTKDGGIAGPKTLEHMVDVVLYLEGESNMGLRALRGLKNRFGPTHRLGLFEMRSEGLAEVEDPSAAFLSDWRGSVAGTVVFPTVEGRRPVLVEVQALVSPSSVPQPRRSVRGLQPARVHQLLAVLERHAGLGFSAHEVYVNVVGGIQVSEPGADLPVALALASSLLDRPLGSLASWGEIGLTGEVRPVAHERRRREESARLGIERVVGPGSGAPSGLRDALEKAFG